MAGPKKSPQGVLCGVPIEDIQQAVAKPRQRAPAKQKEEPEKKEVKEKEAVMEEKVDEAQERDVLSLMEVMKKMESPKSAAKVGSGFEQCVKAAPPPPQPAPETPQKQVSAAPTEEKDQTLLEVLSALKKRATPTSLPPKHSPVQDPGAAVPASPATPAPAPTSLPSPVQPTVQPSLDTERLKKELELARGEVSYYLNMYEEKRDAVIELRKEMGVLLEANGKHQVEMATLRIQNLEDARKEKEDWKADMVKLEDKVASLNALNNKLTSMKATADNEIAELRKKLEEANGNHVQHETPQQVDTAKALLHAQQELEAVRTQFAAYKTRAEATEARHNDERFKLQKSVTELNEQRSQEAYGFRSQLHKEQLLTNEAKDDANKMRTKYTALISRLKGIAHLPESQIKEELQRAEKQLTVDDSHVPVSPAPHTPAAEGWGNTANTAALEDEIAKAKDALSVKEQELAKAKEELKAHQEKYKGLEKDHSTLSSEHATLQNELKYEVFKTNAKQQTVSTLEKQLQEANAQLKAKAASLAEYEKNSSTTAAQAKAEHEGSLEENKRLKAEINMLKLEVSQVRSLQLTNNTLMTQNKVQTETLKQQEARLVALKAEKDESLKKVQSLQSANNALSLQNTTNAEALKQVQKELEEAMTLAVMRSGSPEMCTPSNAQDKARLTQPAVEEVKMLKENVQNLEAALRTTQRELDLAKETIKGQKEQGLSFSQTTEATIALTQAPAANANLVAELDQEKSDREEAERMLRDVVTELKMRNEEYSALEKVSNEQLRELADARVRLAASQNYERQLLSSISGFSQERRSISAHPHHEVHHPMHVHKDDEPEAKIPRVSTGTAQTPMKTPYAQLAYTPYTLQTPGTAMPPPPSVFKHKLGDNEATPDHVSSSSSDSDSSSSSSSGSSALRKRKREELEALRPSQWTPMEVHKLKKLVKKELPGCWTKEAQDQLFESAASLVGKDRRVVENYIWANKDTFCGDAVTPRRPAKKLTQEEDEVFKQAAKITMGETNTEVLSQAQEILAELTGKSTSRAKSLLSQYQRESSV
eukprot:TRINITY_DN12411_c0_g1_i1.p1 TRINITY_DN12411_c0_g1~~TRINITY_DN12411_c0_g1_i1.p1  ORF type:complete len:1111 (+),score=423.49 TRINITY_DN12411_c0_g1_i1:180-3335(+)